MARFKPGQEVVCTYDQWQLGGPKKNEICVVDGVQGTWSMYTFIYLKGWDYQPPNYAGRINFNELHFEPLADITELKEILEQQPQEV